MFTRKLYIDKNNNDFKLLTKLLSENNLMYDNVVDTTLGLFNEDKLVGTISSHKNILKMFCVSKKSKGENYSSILLNEMRKTLKIYNKLFAFTQECNSEILKNLGFTFVIDFEGVSLFEFSDVNINKHIDNLIMKYGTSKKAAIVLNANPFSLGHKSLVEKASKENKEVLVFVVSQDSSVIPFGDRYEMVRLGIQEFTNVRVIPSSDYIISNITFPSYFIQKNETDKFKSSLDAKIFEKYFKKLNIVRRYVGTEPFCDTTREYNNTLKDIIQPSIKLVEVERITTNDEFISASEIRKRIKLNRFESIVDLVPETTLLYLTENKQIIDLIKNNDSRH